MPLEMSLTHPDPVPGLVPRPPPEPLISPELFPTVWTPHLCFPKRQPNHWRALDNEHNPLPAATLSHSHTAS
ncbi:hypothetical protein P7K49_007444 [Saguinus oedipus]|uniref:Uncharacterized protein n=1 Tax=Saguinus oedipus TaxID=9490 RepID=A0ABQ9VUW5_SAGOE|nr:hypothetical protein P7K49_007444 [Saguinus oedipus]